jgi:hypothetical protein
LTNDAIGVLGVIARRDSVSPVNTPTRRQRRHSTVTLFGYAREEILTNEMRHYWQMRPAN